MSVTTVSQAQYMALCSTCALTHPCRTIRLYEDFEQRHRGHRVSLLNRDWLHEVKGSSLAPHRPKGKIAVLLPPEAARRAQMEVLDARPNANFNIGYGVVTAISITLDGLASSATGGRECAAISNGAVFYLDAQVQTTLVLPAGAVINDKACYVYAYGAINASYTTNATGADAAITLLTPSALPVIATLPMPTANIGYNSTPIGIARGFDGIMPFAWGIVVRNYTGLTLAAGNTANYRGVYAVST